MTYGSDISLPRAVAFYRASRNGVDERRLIRPLLNHFRGMWLRNITLKRIYWYRRVRLDSGAAATTLNKEIQVLRRVLAGAGLKPLVRMLPRKPRARKEISPKQFDLLVRLASRNPRWQRALAAATLAAATGLGRRELRKLTWACQDPFRGVIVVDGREYPLTAQARVALVELEKRREGRCRVTDPIITGRSWKRAWASVRKAAGLDIGLRDLKVD